MSLNDKECVTHDGGRANSLTAAYTFIHDNRDPDEPAMKELPAGWWVEVVTLDVTWWLKQQLSIAWRDFLQRNQPQLDKIHRCPGGRF